MSIFKRLAEKYKTPAQVQKYLKTLNYNREHSRETLRSARSALLHKEAHCLEAVFIAAAILEQHGYDPLVLSMESTDYLDHVVYLFSKNNKWGTIGRSRDRGLQGRAPVFKSLHSLVNSYFEPYIDKTGCIKAFQVFHLDECAVDWRNSALNVWKMERFLSEQKHQAFPSSPSRYKKEHQRYLEHGPRTSGKHWL